MKVLVNEIEKVDLINIMHHFVTENEIEYNTYKELYDSYVLKLKNFDWKGDLEQERKEYLEEKKSLKMALNHEEVDADEISKYLV